MVQRILMDQNVVKVFYFQFDVPHLPDIDFRRRKGRVSVLTPHFDPVRSDDVSYDLLDVQKILFLSTKSLGNSGLFSASSAASEIVALVT